MRRSDKWVLVLLGILFGMIVFAIYDIQKRGVAESGSSSPGELQDGTSTDEEHQNTPRNERDIQKARQDGTLRDGD
jgi:hypothetical protein